MGVHVWYIYYGNNEIKQDIGVRAMDIMVIGIAGGTGSGKTTITKKLLSRFGDDVSILYHDNYYKALNELTYEERTKVNYDHPDAFETTMLIRHLRALKRGESIRCPVYDYTVHNRSSQTLMSQPAKVILVEGILILNDPLLRELMDIKIYVDTDADVRILRRIVRDVRDRGRTIESVISQYLNTVKPMHEQFVEPSKKHADIVIPEGGYNQVALDMITERIRSHIEDPLAIGS
jgi:uridine kinase